MPFATPPVLALWTLLLGALIVACTTYEPGYEFEPTATWGGRSNFGGCPHASPSIRVVPKNAGLRIHVGMWNSLQARNRRYADPTVFIYIYKVGPWFYEGSPAATKELAATPVRIRTSTSQLKVSLADGHRLAIDVPQLRDEVTLV